MFSVKFVLTQNRIENHVEMIFHSSNGAEKSTGLFFQIRTNKFAEWLRYLKTRGKMCKVHLKFHDLITDLDEGWRFCFEQNDVAAPYNFHIISRVSMQFLKRCYSAVTSQVCEINSLAIILSNLICLPCLYIFYQSLNKWKGSNCVELVVVTNYIIMIYDNRKINNCDNKPWLNIVNKFEKKVDLKIHLY